MASSVSFSRWRSRRSSSSSASTSVTRWHSTMPRWTSFYDIPSRASQRSVSWTWGSVDLSQDVSSCRVLRRDAGFFNSVSKQNDVSLCLFLSLSLSLSLCISVLTYFPSEPGLAGVYCSKGWWRWWWQLDYWSCKSFKAPVKSSPPTNQHPVLFTGRMPFLSPKQQCQSTEGKNIPFHGLAYSKLTWGSSNFVSDH